MIPQEVATILDALVKAFLEGQGRAGVEYTDDELSGRLIGSAQLVYEDLIALGTKD